MESQISKNVIVETANEFLTTMSDEESNDKFRVVKKVYEVFDRVKPTTDSELMNLIVLPFMSALKQFEGEDLIPLKIARDELKKLISKSADATDYFNEKISDFDAVFKQRVPNYKPFKYVNYNISESDVDEIIEEYEKKRSDAQLVKARAGIAKAKAKAEKEREEKKLDDELLENIPDVRKKKKPVKKIEKFLTVEQTTEPKIKAVSDRAIRIEPPKFMAKITFRRK